MPVPPTAPACFRTSPPATWPTWPSAPSAMVIGKRWRCSTPTARPYRSIRSPASDKVSPRRDWMLRMALVVAVALGSTIARANVVKPDEAAVKVAPAAFPYGEWDALLKKYVDTKGRVDYNALKANDQARLDKLFAAVAATGPKT